VTFTGIDTHAGFNYDLGRTGAVALNLITGVTLSSITTAGFVSGGAGNQDGFGSFNFSLDKASGPGSNDNFASIEFILTRASGSFDSLGDVLTPNAAGYIASAHIVVNGTGIDQTTGYAANGDGTTLVPEPVTMILLGLGLLGLGITVRKRS